jgi:hypothetical protein
MCIKSIELKHWYCNMYRIVNRAYGFSPILGPWATISGQITILWKTNMLKPFLPLYIHELNAMTPSVTLPPPSATWSKH